MARQHGSNGQVLIDPAGGTSYVAVASLNSWTLDATRDRAEVTAFGDTNKTWVQGLPNFAGSLGGFWDPTTTPTAIFDVAFGDTAVGLKLIPSSLTPTAFFSGLAYIDAGINVSSSGAITISGSWVAANSWSLAP
jgi:hypothetical protein